MPLELGIRNREFRKKVKLYFANLDDEPQGRAKVCVGYMFVVQVSSAQDLPVATKSDS